MLVGVETMYSQDQGYRMEFENDKEPHETRRDQMQADGARVTLSSSPFSNILTLKC